MVTYFIMLGIGLILLLVDISLLNKKKSIDKNAETVEGIIYENIKENNSADINSSSVYPVVRFVTNEQKWITKKYDFGFPFGTYKQGNKVIVAYDKNKPENFYLKDNKTKIVLSILVIISIVCILFAIYNLWLLFK